MIEQHDDSVTIVGRQQGCQIRIVSSLVSRKHCELTERGGQLRIRDLGSSNGTYVNDSRRNRGRNPRGRRLERRRRVAHEGFRRVHRP